MAYIGIDLGTTYCAAAQYIDGQAEMVSFGGSHIMPSVVSVNKRGKILVGWGAKNNQAVNPQDTILEVKRHMGKDMKVKLGQKQYSPIEISAMILAEIKKLAEQSLGEEIDGAVITCPAYFDNKQKEATKEAGLLAGLNVIQVLNEPTAAAHAYGAAGQAEEDGLFLVYDLGGGTFDVTVIKKSGGLLEVIGTGGDPDLGGGDFDNKIVDWMIEELKKVDGVEKMLEDKEKLATVKIKLKKGAEEAKKSLCGPPSRGSYQFNLTKALVIDGQPIHFQATLTMEKFEELIKELIEKRSLPWIDVALEKPKEKHKYTEEDLTGILLVGGSTRVPLVHNILETRFPNTEIRGMESGINPDVIVAAGASMLAAERDPESDEELESDLLDVTGHSLSVASLGPKGKVLVLTKIIEKETPIPVKTAHEFATTTPMQEKVQIKVYQGEHAENEPVEKATQRQQNKVILIGEFIMEIDDPQPDPLPIEIGLNLDRNGLLVATAKNKKNGKQIKCEISDVDRIAMSSAELTAKQEKLKRDLAGKIGSSDNPLEQSDSAAPSSQTSRPSPQNKPQSGNQQTHTSADSGSDPKELMNPIIRNLYEKAINNFDNIPQQNQLEVLKIVTEMQQAAKAGGSGEINGAIWPAEQSLERFIIINETLQIMNGPFERSDLDGKLIQTGKLPKLEYSKILSTEVAWHKDDARELQVVLNNGIISKVEVKLNEQQIILTYHKGIQVVDFRSIRQMTDVSGVLGAWRICVFARQLCESINILHDIGAPQVVIHPNRICIFQNKFAVLPTLAGILPVFSELSKIDHSYWMFYTAPEVFRTRGFDEDLLYAADVYSLGRILQLLISNPEYDPMVNFPIIFIERLVELQELDFPADDDHFLPDLRDLIAKMCDFFPENRPELPMLIEAFDSLCKELDPADTILNFLEKGSLNMAKEALNELENNASKDIFTLPEKELILLKVEFEQVRPKPSYGLIIRLLNDALRYYEKDGALHYRIAENYEKFTGHSEHWTYALQHYIEAGKSNQWKKGKLLHEIQSKIIELADKIEDPKKTLSLLSAIPSEVKTEKIFVLLIKSYRQLGYFDQAWKKVFEFYTTYCTQFNYDTFQEALESAKWVSEDLLRNYALLKKQNPGSDVLRAVIWKQLGNEHVGNRYLESAFQKFKA